MTGLATLLSSPALMHGFQGHLHNLALVIELLQREVADPVDAATLRSVVGKRATMLRNEVDAMHRHVALVKAISRGVTVESRDGICDVRAALNEVLPTARVEAAKRQMTLQLELSPAVERIRCDPLAFQQLMIACSTQAIRHCATHSSLVIEAMRDGAHTRIEFRCSQPFECEDHATDREVLGMLARSSGARFTGRPDMSVTFESTP